MRRRHAILRALLIALALVGCTSEIRLNSQVNGWSIGEQSTCAPVDVECVALIAEAMQRLRDRDPFHPPIAEVTVHAEGLYPNDKGVLVPVYRSGGFPTIVLFRLIDGSHRALGGRYMFNDTDPTVFDYGPERQP